MNAQNFSSRPAAQWPPPLTIAGDYNEGAELGGEYLRHGQSNDAKRVYGASLEKER